MYVVSHSAVWLAQLLLLNSIGIRAKWCPQVPSRLGSSNHMTDPEGNLKPPTWLVEKVCQELQSVGQGTHSLHLDPVFWSSVLKEEVNEEEWEICSPQTRFHFDLKHKRKEFIIIILTSHFFFQMHYSSFVTGRSVKKRINAICTAVSSKKKNNPKPATR